MRFLSFFHHFLHFCVFRGQTILGDAGRRQNPMGTSKTGVAAQIRRPTAAEGAQKGRSKDSATAQPLEKNKGFRTKK